MCVSFFELFYLHCPPAAALALELPFPVWAALGYVCNVCPSGFAVPGERWAQGVWSLGAGRAHVFAEMHFHTPHKPRQPAQPGLASHVYRACMHCTMHSPAHRGITRCWAQPSCKSNPSPSPTPRPWLMCHVQCNALLSNQTGELTLMKRDGFKAMLRCVFRLR